MGFLEKFAFKDQDGALAVFDLQGYSHWKPSIQSALEEKTKLQKIEPQMKLMLKNKSERTRKKMIDEGHKILQKRREEIEQYKLKIGKNRFFKNYIAFIVI